MGRLKYAILLFAVISVSCYGKTFKTSIESSAFDEAAIVLNDSIKWADYYYNIHRYKKAIPLYEKNLDNPEVEKTRILKKLALSEAALENTDKSIANIKEYLNLDFNPSFLLNEGFDAIREAPEFKKISNRIVPRVTAMTLLYLFVALIGFYVVFIVSLNKQIHPTSRFLIVAFTFIHSFFVLHISINRANYHFEYPHTYLMTTWASFLYGPLLYFYLKITSQKYKLRAIDSLHILPSLALLVYLISDVYLLSSDTKIQIMLSSIDGALSPKNSARFILVVSLKALSLAIYGYFIRKVYLKSKKQKLLETKKLVWQRNIYYIHILYVITYAIYGIVIVNGMETGILFDTTAAAMALMVIYIGYSANIQPEVFNGAYAYTNPLFPKYEKSGLTPSLSKELKEKLVYLFTEDKIYKENDISLDMVADKLNTTRHNASQIINEHFNVSFHEFVNMYRIREAKQLLLEDKSRRLNIINVAYEVGYNNKVTFNKAFKKDTQLTPTQYQKSVLKVHQSKW